MSTRLHSLPSLALVNWTRLPVVCVVAVLASAAAAGSNTGSVSVNVVQSIADQIVIEYQLGSFDQATVEIDGEPYAHVVLPHEAQLLNAGAPALPHVARSVIIPNDGVMALDVTDAQFYDIENIDLAPSKGDLSRTIDPADVPYWFGDEYGQDAFYPGPLATLGEPYILRDYRGLVVDVNPFQYNPVRRTLRVYTAVTVKLNRVSSGGLNVLKTIDAHAQASRAFADVYRAHFVNAPTTLRYTPLDELGNMLIICYDAWLPNVQPLVTHKNQIGIATTAVGVSTIGNTSTAIKNYILNLYNTTNLAFVLLVGDVAQVATPSASGGASDPSYALLAGSDNYPDIMVGRFSAETAAQVDTQVLRSVEYETLAATQQTWFLRATGIGSEYGGSGQGDNNEADYVHIGIIRNLLLANGYSLVDGLYGPNLPTAGQVTTAVNAGRGLINYCGHGSVTSWSTTGFSNTNVNALTNDNMLPIIFSVACVNGQLNYSSGPCFAEAWMRATHNGEPIGAAATYMSSINQDWDPPMAAQDEFNELLVAGTYHSVGTLFYAGSCGMMDKYPGSSAINMYNTWHIFGDPSLRVVGVPGPTPPTATSVSVDVGVGTLATVTLQATDDGDPNPPAALTYIVTALPAHGRLRDPGAGFINSVPYMLVSGSAVDYYPTAYYQGADSFQFKANDGGTAPSGGDSAVATISISIGGVSRFHNFTLDADPGWSTENAWSFGIPLHGGSHALDPASGHTGQNVYGYNLAGDYANSITTTAYLTTTVLDCRNHAGTELRFWRWLGVETALYDHANIAVSNDGTTWTTIWNNPGGTSGNISDTTWSQQVFDISALADDQPTVYIRWGMGPTDSSVSYPGWNIDDIEIWGNATLTPIPGDVDCDGTVNYGDINPFVIAISGQATYEDTYPSCRYLNADVDGDGLVTYADINPFVILLSTKQ